MVTHTPWKNPPIQEVVFEIRFPAVQDYSLFVGGIAASQKDKFPISQKLPIAELPPFVLIEGAVRHRFSSDVKKNLIFQTGLDVMSVNCIADYPGFNDFLNCIKDVLESAKLYIPLNQILRVSIRYINVFKEVKDPHSVLNINPIFQELDLSKTKQIASSYISQEQEDVWLSVNIAFSGDINNANDTKNLMLDIEAFCFGTENVKNWDIELISSWLTEAQHIAWLNFNNLVSESEKEARI